jgi:acetyl esterase/lipase
MPWRRRRFVAGALFSALSLGMTGAATAGPLLDRLRERRQSSGQASTSGRQANLANVAYGPDAAQVYDVYLPTGAPRGRRAPVLFMVHGGAWTVGDKAMSRVVDAKVARWGPQGFVLVSVNYRLLPDVAPDGQLRDVALALAHAQAHALDWGGDPEQFILMGHSSGAHLVSLLAVLAVAEPASLGLSGPPVRGTVALDSAAMDVPAIMGQAHMRLYDTPFGQDSSYWRAMSPVQQLRQGTAPVLAVCSTRRQDACVQARAFVTRASQLGVRAQWLGRDLSHGDINAQLGQDAEYTRSVEAFMATLSPVVAQHLSR